jgi:hypothetical protein
MAFGQKAGSLKNLKKNLAKSSGGKGFIKYIPKNSSLNVRFITEPEGWLSYAEHYDQVMKKGYPCTTEVDCPGCKLGLEKKNRYLTNVANLDNQDRVTALQIPVSLANTLVTKYEKWGSITDRDLELSKQGAGLDTTYDLDYSPPDRKRVDKYTPLDLEEVLTAAFNDVFSEDEEEEAPAPKKAAKKIGSPKKRAAAPEPADEEPKEEPAPKRKTKKSSAAPKKAKEPEFEPDNEPGEDNEPDPEDEEDGYTVEELEAMTLGQLRKVARDEFELNVTGLSKADILEAILESSED